MSDLVSFLAQHPVSEMHQEVSIGGRLAEYKFKIQPMTQSQFYKYQQLCTILNKDKTVKFNSGRFNELVILNHVISPDFRNTTTLASAGVNTPEEFINKFFLAGELVQLSDKISEASGFNQTDQELEDEVKNF